MNWLLLKKYKEKRDNLQFPLYLYNNNNNTLDLFSFVFLKKKKKKKNANVLSLLLNSLKSIIDLLM